VDEAFIQFKIAVEIAPNEAVAHVALGAILCDHKHDYEGAIAEFQKAIAIDERNANAHHNLGVALKGKGDQDGAVAAYRKALALDPNFAEAHIRLGNHFRDKANWDAAFFHYRELIRLRPDYPEAHYGLGGVLNAKGDLDGARVAYQKAIALRPDHAEAHCDLGAVFQRKCEFRAALEERRIGHALGSKQPNWRNPSAEWVREAEQLVALDAKLPKVLKREAQPADSAEWLGLAKLCQEHKKLYAAAAGFYKEAFDAEPKLVGPNRYDAACVAALAGCGKGKDADKLDDKERCRLRRQALDWLRADLKAKRLLLDKDANKPGPTLIWQMQHWQADADFAGVRGLESLADLPKAELQAWQKLWNDVADLLKRAKEMAASEKK